MNGLSEADELACHRATRPRLIRRTYSGSLLVNTRGKRGEEIQCLLFRFSFVIFVYSLQDTAHRRLGIYIGSRLKI